MTNLSRIEVLFYISYQRFKNYSKKSWGMPFGIVCCAKIFFCVKDRSGILFRLLEDVGGQIRADEKDTADSLTLLPA